MVPIVGITRYPCIVLSIGTIFLYAQSDVWGKFLNGEDDTPALSLLPILELNPIATGLLFS